MNPDAAFDLEARVLAARRVERRTWVLLAEQLYAFHTAQAWRDLGWETFTDWLGCPEVSLGRRQAYRLIQAWAWSQDQHVDPEQLERVDLTKLSVVIPAVLRGAVSLQEALSDAEMLSRADLTVRYVDGAPKPAETLKEPMERCTHCGRMRTLEPNA